MKNTIGVHYQCWKNKKAVENVLNSFRTHYPIAPIRMISDAGDDFTDLAEKYNCIFDYENENIYPRAVLVGHPNWKKGTHDHGARVWLRRLYDTCKKLDTDWIIFMEDDLITIDTIKEFPSTTAAGKDCSNYSTELIYFVMENEISIKDFCWFGYGLCGGGILNRQFMVDAYEKYIDKIDFNLLAKLDNRILGWPDILINVFISITGGTYMSGWTPHTSAFQHGDKSLYEELQGSIFTTDTQLYKDMVGENNF